MCRYYWSAFWTNPSCCWSITQGNLILHQQLLCYIAGLDIGEAYSMGSFWSLSIPILTIERWCSIDLFLCRLNLGGYDLGRLIHVLIQVLYRTNILGHFSIGMTEIQFLTFWTSWYPKKIDYSASSQINIRSSSHKMK